MRRDSDRHLEPISELSVSHESEELDEWLAAHRDDPRRRVRTTKTTFKVEPRDLIALAVVLTVSVSGLVVFGMTTDRIDDEIGVKVLFAILGGSGAVAVLCRVLSAR
jgi:hypothetical protein